MKAYEAFDLRIAKAGRSYKVWASSAMGEAEGTFRLPVPFAEVEALLADLEGPPGPPRPGHLSTRKQVESVGGRLYRAVFAGDIGAHFAASLQHAEGRGAGLRILLDLGGAPELARWPWELLYDRGLKRFPAVAAATPIVRRLSLPLPMPPLRTALPLSVLLVTAAPVDLGGLAGEREVERIEEALSPLRAKGLVAVDHLRPATLEALGRRLRGEPVHVIHFIGHGAFDREQEEGVLFFEDDRRRSLPVDGQRLGAMLLGRDLRLVVLNACEGARHGETDAFDGVAQTLLQASIPAVVAMQMVIPDRAALHFAERFYGALAEGHPVDAAVAEARLALLARNRQFHWAAPVLYLRSPDGVLFDLEGADAGAILAEPAPPSRLRRLAPWLSIAAAALLALGIALFVHGRSDAEHAHPWVGALPAPQECMSPVSPEILFVPIPPGSFRMGSNRGKMDHRPAHEVTLTQPFCMGAYEITQGQWEAVMGDRPDGKGDESKLPKASVTKEEVMRFIEELNRRCPTRHFFLPTDAQWEFAARAGSQGTYSFGDDPSKLDQYANCGSGRPRAIGSLQPNQWKLYDMQGNVSEWVADFYTRYDEADAVDPAGPPAGNTYITRGGNFGSAPDTCSVVHRAEVHRGYRRDDVGFRIAMDLVH